jgi:hypothetical protein
MHRRISHQTIAWLFVCGALLLAIGHFSASRNAPVRFNELERVAIAVPYAEQGTPGGAMLQSVRIGLNYLNQFIVYLTLKGVMVTEPAQLRYIDLAFMLLALVWIYRVGTLCVNSATGVLAALMLACCPPDIWGRFALCTFIILLNWERFLYAIQQNTFFAWGIWSVVTVLLFFNRVFAEPIVLQTWFLALLAVLLFRRWFPVPLEVQHEDTYEYHHDHGHRRHRGHRAPSPLKWDSTLLPFFMTLSSAWVVIFSLSIVGAIFFLQLKLTGVTFLMIFIVSLVVMPAVGALLLTFPMFNTAWHVLKDWLLEIVMRIVYHRPRNMFAQVSTREILNACFAYSAAILLYIPYLFFIHQHVNIFIDYWELSRWYAFTGSLSPVLAWFAVLLPCIAVLITAAGFLKGLLPRTRFVSICCLFIPSLLYIIQQRYAVFAAPFYILCCSVAFVTPVELFILALRRRNEYGRVYET